MLPRHASTREGSAACSGATGTFRQRTDREGVEEAGEAGVRTDATDQGDGGRGAGAVCRERRNGKHMRQDEVSDACSQIGYIDKWSLSAHIRTVNAL